MAYPFSWAGFAMIRVRRLYWGGSRAHPAKPDRKATGPRLLRDRSSTLAW